MQMEGISATDLGREVREIRGRYSRLQADQAFLVWFLQAYGGVDEPAAIAALPGRGGEKGTDAVLIDEDLRIAFIVQAKYRGSIMRKAESRNDVLDLVRVGRIVTGPTRDFGDFCETLEPAAKERLRAARDRILRRGFRLQLCYVTTGRCSKPLENEARREARRIKLRREAATTFVLYDGERVLGLLQEYLDGAAPPVPSVDIHLDGEVLKRDDRATGIELRVFWVKGSEIANLYERSGIRIFHRNVRGFLGLGDSAINGEMGATITKDPRSFVYLNNGVTIVCDEARREEELINLTNPQIINGQQTTRVLDLAARDAGRVAVQVRVITVPAPLKQRRKAYEELIGDTVRATNRQNAIQPSDLKSNDRIQVRLERELRKLNYEYVRKRQAKGEARAQAPQHRWVVSKVDFAKAVAPLSKKGSRGGLGARSSSTSHITNDSSSLKTQGIT
jgi:AIPR protein